MYPQQLSLIQVFSKGHHIIHVVHQLLLPKTIKEIYIHNSDEKYTSIKIQRFKQKNHKWSIFLLNDLVFQEDWQIIYPNVNKYLVANVYNLYHNKYFAVSMNCRLDFWNCSDSLVLVFHFAITFIMVSWFLIQNKYLL